MQFQDYQVIFGSAVRSLFQYTEGRIRTNNRELFRPDQTNELDTDVTAQVCIEDGIVAGYWAASKSEPSRSIIIVHPLHRNKGIGTQLIKRVHRNQIYASILVGGTNVASIKTALKAGLWLVGAGTWDNGKVWLDFRGEEYSKGEI